MMFVDRGSEGKRISSRMDCLLMKLGWQRINMKVNRHFIKKIKNISQSFHPNSP